MLSSLLLLDLFCHPPTPTSPRIPAHCVFVFRSGSNCQFPPVCVSCPVQRAGTVSSGHEAEGWTPGGSGGVLKSCFASHPRRNFPESIFVFRSLPIFLLRSPRQFTLKPGLQVSRPNVAVSQADHYYSLHSWMVLMLWLLISISISPRKTALTVSLSVT